MRLKRLIPLIEGLSNYGNPFQIAMKRAFARNGVLSIKDRATGVRVDATVASYHVFGETWYTHDYDVAGCPIRAKDVVIDIGANQGFFSCYAASKGARVYAFEPFPENFARLKANVDRNQFSSLVNASQAAVSAADGKATLHCSPYRGGVSHTLEENVASQMEISGSVEVEAKSLNSILDSIEGPIRLCKIDCEGSELGILQALSNPSRIDSFAVEFHPTAYSVRELAALMIGWGTHQVCFGRSDTWMLYAVRNDAILEFSESFR